MKRIIETTLKEWKESPRRKPLILRGARQVGKTYLLTQFGKSEFNQNFVMVDLEKHPEWHPIFEKNLDAKRILAELEVVLEKKIESGNTLLIFDEIQSCPRAIMALRYFYEEIPSLHVVAAGSLLEFALGSISFPVGRIQFLNLWPMNFVEFLWATQKEKLSELILDPPFHHPQKLPSQTIHRFLLDELRKYFLVGGMPEAVSTYAQKGSFQESFQVHAELVHSFREDFSKYFPRVEPQCLELVLRGAAKKVTQQIKYSQLADGYSQPTLKRAFDLLCKARLVYKIEAASPAGLPLGASANPKKFKALLVDLSLMHILCGFSPESIQSEKNLLTIYQGALAEQFVGQELLSALDGSLYYWSREEKSSSAEVDFLIAFQGNILPIEVKSGSSGRLKSLHLLLQNYPSCSNGYIFSEAPLSFIKKQRLSFIPLYYSYAFAKNGYLQ